MELLQTDGVLQFEKWTSKRSEVQQADIFSFLTSLFLRFLFINRYSKFWPKGSFILE